MGIGTLIVGLGQIGMGYDLGLDPATHVYSHARAVDVHPAYRLLGGVDPSAERRAVFSGAYRCPAYGDVESALQDVSPDLVVIAVPTQDHALTLQRILGRARPSAVLCEKPLAYSDTEARAMAASCAERGARLFVNYMRRSDPGAIEVKRRLSSGEIASPVKGVAWYSKGLRHNGSHFFNLIEDWLGEMTDAQVLDAGRCRGREDSEPDLFVRFERGAISFLSAHEENYSHYTMELVCPNGRLRYEKGGRQISWQMPRADSALPGYSMLAEESESIASGMDRYQWHVADQLAVALAGGDGHVCDGAGAVRTIESISRILEKP